MRILSVDAMSASLDWIMRCQDDGHQVRIWSKPCPLTAMVGKGIVERVDHWQDHADWADLIFVADNTVHLSNLEAFRKKGKMIFGPNPIVAEWELDRGIGQSVFKRAGIPVLEGTVFSDYDKAIAFVKRTMGTYVSKPSGDADKALSYVSKSPADMIFMLERWKRTGKLKSPFILQDFKAGTEMAVGGWFGRNGFNTGWCENWEFKKLMNGDLGVATGEQGTVLRYVRRSKLADKVLAPLTKVLERLDYVGYIDVNCIIDDEGTPWPLEFTCRPGWPTFNIQQALHRGDHAEWMVQLCQGEDAKAAVLDTVAVGVVLSIPDYPYSKLTKKEVAGIPLYGVTDSIRPFVHPCEMQMAIAPRMVGDRVEYLKGLATAGDYVLVTTGIGQSIKEAKTGAYRVMKRLRLPNSPAYRTDIGDRLKRQLPNLWKHGYATGLLWTLEQD